MSFENMHEMSSAKEEGELAEEGQTAEELKKAGGASLGDRLKKLGAVGALGAVVMTAEGCAPEAGPAVSGSGQDVAVEKAPEKSCVPVEVLNGWMSRLLKDVSFGNMEKGNDGNIYLEHFGKIISLDAGAQETLKSGIAKAVEDIPSTDSDMVKNMKFKALQEKFNLNVGALGKEISDPSVLPEQVLKRFNVLKEISGGLSADQGASEKVSKKDHVPASQMEDIGLGQSSDSASPKGVRQSPDFDKNADF